MNELHPRLALLWRSEDASALSAAMGTEAVRVFAMSQKAYSAALGAGLKLSLPFFSKVLSAVSLDAIDAAAERAVALAIERDDPRSDFDRTALWHNARELAFLKRGTVEAIRSVRPSSLIAVGDPNDAEARAVKRVATLLGLEFRLVAPLPHIESPPLEASDPPAHAIADLSSLSQTDDWVCALGVGATDWPHLLPKLRRRGQPMLIIADERHSGDLAVLYRATAQDRNLRILPLWRETAHRYNERGDNSAYAADVRKVMSKVIAAGPAQAAVCDLRRTETAVAMDSFRNAGIPLTIFAHAGASMRSPYRFSDAELALARILVWTATAAQDYGGGDVAAPRRIRTDPFRRAGRWTRRILRAATQRSRQVGLVVTSDALFAAPEFDLESMLRAFSSLAAGMRDTRWRMQVRLRSLEDSADFFRSVSDIPHVAFETTAERSFITFVRECDLVVELGPESTAFLEAAGSGVPYVRVGSPRVGRTRYGRPRSVVPRLDADDPWTALAPYLRFSSKRVPLARAQNAWLLRETRPRHVEPGFKVHSIVNS